MRLIGITSYAREPAGRRDAVEMIPLPAGYVDALRDVGAMPVILPSVATDPDALLDRLDGLVLAGGGDLDSALFDQERHASVYDVSAERDSFELALARAALKHFDLPILGICRGLQLLNVACGGSLHQHVPEHFGETISHRSEMRTSLRHSVRLDPATRLARWSGAPEIDVVSWHHQAIDRLAERVRPVAWSADDLIEAIEIDGHPWCVAVQWHPEMQFDEPHARGLFEAFVNA